jgi:methylenetetrahydrofolate reductase (NADPH)
MRIIDKINNLDKDVYYSFEYYPPKTEKGIENLYLKLDKMLKLKPIFIDMTWGAGGSTSNLTLELCTNISKKYNIDEVQMHLTCTNMNESTVINALEEAKNNGIQNIVALRGDEYEESINSRFKYAVDLIKFIKKKYNNYFGIAVAGYPEGHPNATSYEKDLIYLKDKIDAGGDYIITQFFYDINTYLKFVNDCRNIGINCPIIPGILPFFNYNSFHRMISLTNVTIPQHLLDHLEKIKDNNEKIYDYGIEVCVQLCNDLIAHGVNYLHIYTLNKDYSIILDKIGLL